MIYIHYVYEKHVYCINLIRRNEHFADSILGQHPSFRSKFSTLNRKTISWPPERVFNCWGLSFSSIPTGWILCTCTGFDTHISQSFHCQLIFWKPKRDWHPLSTGVTGLGQKGQVYQDKNHPGRAKPIFRPFEYPDIVKPHWKVILKKKLP